MIEALVVPGVVALAGLAARGALWIEHKRLAQLHAFATSRGWHWSERDDVWATAFDGEPFGRGTGMRAEDVMTGRHADRDLVAFDYSYRTHGTDGNGQRTTQVHRYAVAVLSLPAPLPLVELEASRLPRLFGRGIELESEEFNARYRVRAEDPRLAYDVLPARTMQLLLDRPDLSLRLLGGCAVAWERGRLDPGALLVRLDTMTAVLDGVPPFVWKDRS